MTTRRAGTPGTDRGREVGSSGELVADLVSTQRFRRRLRHLPGPVVRLQRAFVAEHGRRARPCRPSRSRWWNERAPWWQVCALGSDPGHRPTRSRPGRSAPPTPCSASLVDRRPEAAALLCDADAFAGPYGIRGVHCDEPTYDPDTYWRGSSWPQLDYLLLVALRAAGFTEQAAELAQQCAAGAVGSGWAEYWNADTGVGGGATPQTWTALALLFG
ncbi:MAG: hypothetical protein R2710_12655 [Acidimicrobiales bacterium]